MQKSGFFNSYISNGIPDRRYNADDYTDNLSVIISNGVLRSPDNDLKVSSNGLTVTVKAGKAWINGHYYHNTDNYIFPTVTVPASGTRTDAIILRMDKTTDRSVKLVYVKSYTNPTRNDNVYDLVLATITVTANSTSLDVIDTRSNQSICGWLYSVSGDDSFFESLDDQFNDWFIDTKNTLSSVTLFQRYNWRSVLSSTTNTVQFNIPQWDPDVCILEVYINGVLDYEGVDYTINNSTLTFVRNLTLGTEVVVKVYKSIDGTGIDTVADEITALQNQVDSMHNIAIYNYNCSGSNDNIAISDIAQALYNGSYDATTINANAKNFLDNLGGNSYLGSLPNDAQITINIVGKLGVSSPYSGTGTSTDRHKWFSLGTANKGNKKIVFDFANCERFIVYPSTNTDNIIFYGTDMDIHNVNAYARCTATNCNVEMFAGRYNTGIINVVNSKLRIVTTGTAIISEHGDFTNCFVYCSSANDHALCFAPLSASLIRLNGGTYYAYCASTQKVSSIIYVYGTETNAAVIANNINCPTQAVTNFYQTNLAVTYAGKTYINGVTSTLTSLGSDSYRTITGLIALNKPVGVTN